MFMLVYSALANVNRYKFDLTNALINVEINSRLLNAIYLTLTWWNLIEKFYLKFYTIL